MAWPQVKWHRGMLHEPQGTKIESIICNGQRNDLNFEICNKNSEFALNILIVLIALLYLVHETDIGSLHKKMPPLLPA
jgi:hypothetical protein